MANQLKNFKSGDIHQLNDESDYWSVFKILTKGSSV